MRVRTLKSFYYEAQKRRVVPGDVLNIPDSEARTWLHHGMAMLDKTVDVPENKAEPVQEKPVEAKPKRKRKARK